MLWSKKHIIQYLKFVTNTSYRWVLWVQTEIYALPHSLQWCRQYHVKLNRVIMAVDCILQIIDYCVFYSILSHTHVFHCSLSHVRVLYFIPFMCVILQISSIIMCSIPVYPTPMCSIAVYSIPACYMAGGYHMLGCLGQTPMSTHNYWGVGPEWNVWHTGLGASDKSGNRSCDKNHNSVKFWGHILSKYSFKAPRSMPTR